MRPRMGIIRATLAFRHQARDHWAQTQGSSSPAQPVTRALSESCPGTSSPVCVLYAKATTTLSANEYTTTTSKAQAMWRDSFAQTSRVQHRDPIGLQLPFTDDAG